MAKPRNSATTLPRVKESDLQKERARRVGQHVQLRNSDRFKGLIERFRKPQLSGTITNAWMGAGEWSYEIEIHELPPQNSGYTGRTLLQVREHEIRIGGVCPYHRCRL